MARFITFIVTNATNNTLAKLLACLKPELRNIFQGIHQPFTNIPAHGTFGGFQQNKSSRHGKQHVQTPHKGSN